MNIGLGSSYFTQEYNGTTWAFVNQFPNTISQINAAGTPNDGLVSGGVASQEYKIAYKFKKVEFTKNR